MLVFRKILLNEWFHNQFEPFLQKQQEKNNTIIRLLDVIYS